eukprot:4995466-Alexandrium_andersonii.AAC.1
MRAAGGLASDVTAVVTGAAVSDAMFDIMLGCEKSELPTCPCGRDVAHFAHVCWDCPLSQPMRDLVGVRPPPVDDRLARRTGWPSVTGAKVWAKQELED